MRSQPEVTTGSVPWTYRTLGTITAKVVSATVFSRSRTTEEVDSKLREEALKRGADAVIGVRYSRGMSALSWKAVEARGTAVVASDTQSDPGQDWKLPGEIKRAKKERKTAPAWPS